MAVYVDKAMIPFRRMKMNHMIADTSEELLEMADKIGVARKWIQYQGTPSEHFDICASKRLLAIKNGAEEITWKKCGQMIAERKKAHIKSCS